MKIIMNLHKHGGRNFYVHSAVMHNSPLFIWCYNKSEHCKNLPLFQSFSYCEKLV